MTIEQQFIFLFSALGAINGFVLSGYFLLKKKEKLLSDYFLGGLLLMLSTRIFKSVFLHFNRNLFEVFIQFGLGACFLIGPFLFLYIKSSMDENHNLKKNWLWHIIPYIIIIITFSYLYSYYEDRQMWRYFINLIYKQWLIYILASAFWLRPVFRKILNRSKKLSNQEFWLMNIFIGTSIILLAFETIQYTSYIVGALSFTFILYISILLWFYKKSNKSISLDPALKYVNSGLNEEDLIRHMVKLNTIISDDKPYLDHELTLSKLSKMVGISSKDLSQVINQKAGQNYSNFIASCRIHEAKRMFSIPEFESYKIAAIAYESGFNSLSSFNSYFKKIVGMTAQSYKKDLQNRDNVS